MTKPDEPEKLVTTSLRLPRRIYDDIKAAADLNGWAMNTEIITRLDAEISDRKVGALKTQVERLQRMIQELLDK